LLTIEVSDDYILQIKGYKNRAATDFEMYFLKFWYKKMVLKYKSFT